MRSVVRSRTYVAQLKDLLDQGIERFGVAVVEQKLALVDHTLEVRSGSTVSDGGMSGLSA